MKISRKQHLGGEMEERQAEEKETDCKNKREKPTDEKETHKQKKIRKGVVRGKRANSNTTRLLHHVKTLRENGNGNKRERERECVCE